MLDPGQPGGVVVSVGRRGTVFKRAAGPVSPGVILEFCQWGWAVCRDGRNLVASGAGVRHRGGIGIAQRGQVTIGVVCIETAGTGALPLFNPVPCSIQVQYSMPDPFCEGTGVVVRETFDAEETHSLEQQREGWQAILDRFARHVESRR